MENNKTAGAARHSIRFRVTATMAVCFIVMFVALYIMFSVSMGSMLTARENDVISNQVDMARNMLLMSVENLPALTKEWAELSYMYDYVTGENDLIYQNNFLPDRSYEINKVNFLAVLDQDSTILFEKFYDYGNHRTITHDTSLQNYYDIFSSVVHSNYQQAISSENPASYSTGHSGFFSKNGNVYYLSAHPVADMYSGRPFVGTFLFGRIIDEEELGAMTTNGGIEFTVLESAELTLAKQELQALTDDGYYVDLSSNHATGYGALKDIHGQPSLLVAVTNSRALNASGQSFINYVIFLAALGCVIVLLVIINLLNRIVLNPLASLAAQVNSIDMDSVNTSLKRNDQDREFFNLTTSINNMLTRITTDRDLIQKKNESLFKNAHFDDLTGLRNRASTMHLIDEAITKSKKQSCGLTVFYFDIDRFKYINDTLGHAMGDYLIEQIADKLRSVLCDEAIIIGRMGGDKFAAIAEGVHEESERQAFAERIFSAFQHPFVVKERPFNISISIGSSTYPEDGQDMETLVRNAEIAMYQVKDAGGRFYTYYQSEFHKMLHRRIYIENQLRADIQNGCKAFEAHFQPKASARNGKIWQCEALIRWNTPDGMVYPSEFIPQAEESGLIIPLTWWMIRECCKQGKRFAQNGLPTHIAINVPAQALTHEDFISTIQNAARETGMDIRKLDIEITEYTLLEDMEKVNQVFYKLHALGIEISVDDFGTGYSSLSYLNKLAIDRIKVDRSFVMGMDTDEDSRAIVRAVVAMAKSLHMAVTAEGVETQSQCRLLREIGCDELQGYLISRALGAQEYIEFVQRWNPAPLIEDGDEPKKEAP
ncbi:EAL domain-containing protein [Christensenellaceae bacterium OttesenSCG-928-K19]|nr:EAL domain-containing protein [Christensenellaceae bacterium OttesenSCG-928-K19]